MSTPPSIMRTLCHLFLALTLVLTGAPESRASAATSPVELVLVYKSAKVMELLTGNQVVRSYRVALGRNPLGHKQKAGDCRTPEGCYIIDSRKSDSKFYRSLHVSYPNSQDLATAKKRGFSPGRDIMIHGLPKGYEDLADFHFRMNWTKGCIAVNNAEMDEIWRLIPNGTRIIIKP
jgi:murein L,D-transpeptidase YafK